MFKVVEFMIRFRGFTTEENPNNLIKKIVRDKAYRFVYKKIARVDRYLQYNQNAIRCLFLCC